MHICMHMCNKNVQLSSIHGKNVDIFMLICMQMLFFPVYGRNLHIFITHAHTNVHINVHFYLTICGAPLQVHLKGVVNLIGYTYFPQYCDLMLQQAVVGFTCISSL